LKVPFNGKKMVNFSTSKSSTDAHTLEAAGRVLDGRGKRDFRRVLPFLGPTDLAEFIGAAVGFNLLFWIPLLCGGVLAAIATFLILGLERFGFRPLEAVITTMVGLIAGALLQKCLPRAENR
jgi:Natural resistance-associated macrophage protein